jgi:hypothetical protein
MRTIKRRRRIKLRPRFIVLIVFSLAVLVAASEPKVTETAVLITKTPVAVTEKLVLVTEETILTPTPEATPEPEKAEGFSPYNIPLDVELQKYTFEICSENNVDYIMVLAVMDQESDYREKVISKTNDYGIMQINQVNHEWLEDKLGVDDFLDAKQNILAGVYMLGILTEKYEETSKVLMAYNCGENGAKKLWDKGIYSTEYSRNIQEKMEELAGK